MSDDQRTPPGGPPGSLAVQIDEDVANGVYSNFQVVGNNETEFVLDFAFLQPNLPRAKVRSRVILSPKHAKSLARVLAQRVADYEQRFGPIVLRDGPGGGMSGSGLPN